MSSLLHLSTQNLRTILLAPIVLFATIGLTLFTLLLLPYRLLVWLLAKVLRPDLDTMVTGAGNVFFTLGTPERPAANLCVLVVIDGAMDLEHASNLFQTRILDYKEKGVFMYNKLKQSVSFFMGYPFLRTDENFDLKNHIRAYDYTEGGLGFPDPTRVTQQELEERMPALIVLPWKRGQSNWECLLINNYSKSEKDPEKRTLVVFRMDHAIGDGYSLHKLLCRLLQLQEPESKFKISSNGQDKSFMIRLKMCAVFPFKLFYDMAELALLNLLPRHSGWASVGEKKLAVSAFTYGIPVDDIKAIKNKLGVSYMSVLFAAVCAALGRLALESDRSARQILCVVPLPKPSNRAALTNNVYAGLLSLPIAQKAIQALVQEIEDNLFRMSTSYAILGVDLLLQMCSTLPLLMIRRGYEMLDPDAFLSVYPVPDETFRWEGSDISEIIGCGGSASASVPFGAGIFMHGTGGMQRVSIVVNKASFPCPNCDEKLPNFDEFVREEVYGLLQKNEKE